MQACPPRRRRPSRSSASCRSTRSTPSPPRWSWPAARRCSTAFPRRRSSRSPRTGRSPACTATPATSRTGTAIKRTHLVLGTLKSPRLRPNGRSSDFIAPSQSNGCAMAARTATYRAARASPTRSRCSRTSSRSCARRSATSRARAASPRPNQCDPVDWVYDIGENSDCSVDALVVRQRPRSHRPLRAHRRREGVVRHEGRQPRPARARPARRHARALLAHAARDLAARRRAHPPDRAAHRGDRRLRRARATRCTSTSRR